MSYVWAGITVNPAVLGGYGYQDPLTVDSVSYPRYLAYMVAGYKEVEASRVAAAASAAAAAASVANQVQENFVVNSGFAINQRTYVSGTSMAAGVYAHDRWKAGAGGGTYTFAQATGPKTTITVTAGTLLQVVDASYIHGGTYTLSWFGTAQARVDTGAYAASPITVSGKTAGTAISVEFGTGTVGTVKFEPGATATAWPTRPKSVELELCKRFYQRGNFRLNVYAAAAAASNVQHMLPVEMRATPTVGLTNTPMTNCASYTVTAQSAAHIQVTATATAAAAIDYVGSYTLTAEL
jgi:hypothetical protein